MTRNLLFGRTTTFFSSHLAVMLVKFKQASAKHQQNFLSIPGKLKRVDSKKVTLIIDSSESINYGQRTKQSSKYNNSSCHAVGMTTENK